MPDHSPPAHPACPPDHVPLSLIHMDQIRVVSRSKSREEYYREGGEDRGRKAEEHRVSKSDDDIEDENKDVCLLDPITNDCLGQPSTSLRLPQTSHTSKSSPNGAIVSKRSPEAASPSETDTLVLVPTLGAPGFVTKENGRSWRVLFGCFLVAFTAMGYGMLQGAFQAFYVSSPSSPPGIRSHPESVISLVGGMLAFVCTAGAGVSGRLGDRFGYKPVIAIGMVLGIVSLVATAFSTTLAAVFVSQGFLFGLAQCLVVPLILSLPSQHFDTHRALATGIVGSAAGWGGGVLAILTRVMLTRFGGTKWPLLILAAGYAVTWSVGWWLLGETEERREYVRRRWRERKSGVNEEKRAAPRKRWDLNLGGVERNSVFWALWIGVVISTFAYLAPFQYIGTYTIDKLPELEGTFKSAMPLVAMAWGLGTGRVLGGQIADRVGAIQTLVLAMYTGGLLQLVVWHFATSFAGIIGFSVSYGMFGGAALSLIPPVVKQLFPESKEHFAALVGLVMMSTAPGQFAGPSMAGAILTASGRQWISFQVFSGFLQIVGGLAAMWAWYRGIGLRFGNVRRVVIVKEKA